MTRSQTSWTDCSKLSTVYRTLPRDGDIYELVRTFEHWLLTNVQGDNPVLRVGPASITDEQAQVMAFHLIKRQEEEENHRQRDFVEIVITQKGPYLWHVTDHNSSTQVDSFMGCMEWASGALSPGGPEVVFKWVKGWEDD